MMSLEKYKKEVLRLLEDTIYDDEYIKRLDDFLEKSYYESVHLSELVGEDRISPDGCALGICFLYPDIP